MSEAEKLGPKVLVVTDRFVLWKNHAIVDHHGRLLLRLQFASNAEARRIFAALPFCGVLDADGDER